MQRQSRGRIEDGGPDWAILTKPSPAASNNSSPHFTAFADRPDFSVPAGFYTDSVTISLINNEPGAALFYTLDGKEPGSTSTPYSGPITLKETAVLKAIAVSADSSVLPSFVEYATYFVNANHTLPVVSVAGAQLRALANGNKNLAPQGSIEYFNQNGARKASAYGEFNSHGQDSWVNDQRSLDLIARDEMGYDKALDEKIFELSDRKEFQRLILRAAGDDNYPGNFLPNHKGCAHLRDAYVHNLAKKGGLHLDVRLSEKAIVYIDGQYWGVYDLREIPDDHDYTEYYYGQDKYNIQYILTWANTWAEYGGQQALNDWNALYLYIQTHNMAVPEYYQYVDSLLDVTSLADYVLVNSITVCSDWLNYNTGWWRGLDTTGSHRKWGYILWDNDATFGYYINYSGVPDVSATALPCNPEVSNSYNDPKGHLKILRRLLANPGFRQYYTSRYIDLMNTVFGCDYMLSYLDTVANRIAPEMTQHAERWGGSLEGWQTNVDSLRSYITRRCQALSGGLMECYDLNGPYSVTFDTDPGNITGMQVNSLTITEFPYTGTYYGGVNLKLSVLPDPAAGYTFDRWLSGSQDFQPGDSVATVVLDLNGPDTIVAHFVPVSSAVGEPAMPGNMPFFRVLPTVFSTSGTVLLDLPAEAAVSLRLYSLQGKEVAVLARGAQVFAPGQYAIPLDLAGSGLPAGLYVLQCTAGDFRQGAKLIYAP